jgi:hypothetical protein
LIASLAIGLILGFDDGRERFRLFYWVFNLAISVCIALVAILVHMLPIKLLAISKGYLVEIKQYIWGIVGGVMVGLASIGKAVLFSPFELVFHHHEGMRLGRFRYGLNYFDMGLTALMGPLANLLLAIVFKGVYSVNPSVAALNAMRLNVMYAAATMLPIPKTPGSYVFFGSRVLFILGLTLILGVGISLFFWPLWLAVAAGAGTSALLTIVYFIAFEYR